MAYLPDVPAATRHISIEQSENRIFACRPDTPVDGPNPLKLSDSVNALGGIYGTALQTASYRGDEAVVRLLLNKGANVNAKGGSYGTALQAASY
ncbi:hypothetical protein GE09DRAFT_1098657 [Coniochaeta sp. 2T2.1]|nr:hypothetical protein GE09DRAFT_1098657 [Coniochaeta sp. 2T2.1]